MGGDKLKPLTLAQMMEEEEHKVNEANGSNWRLSMEKRELDFFAKTLNSEKMQLRPIKITVNLLRKMKKVKKKNCLILMMRTTMIAVLSMKMTQTRRHQKTQQ